MYCLYMVNPGSSPGTTCPGSLNPARSDLEQNLESVLDTQGVPKGTQGTQGRGLSRGRSALMT